MSRSWGATCESTTTCRHSYGGQSRLKLVVGWYPSTHPSLVYTSPCRALGLVGWYTINTEDVTRALAEEACLSEEGLSEAVNQRYSVVWCGELQRSSTDLSRMRLCL